LNVASAISAAFLMQSALMQPASAEVIVSGSEDAVVVNTRDSSLEDVLIALRKSFNLEYRIVGSLPRIRILTGTYSGPFTRVVARLLAGYDYVVRSRQKEFTVTVFGAISSQSSAMNPAAALLVDRREHLLPEERPAVLTGSSNIDVTRARGLDPESSSDRNVFP
jgi:hypothetical protein